MWQNPQIPADLVFLTKGILNGKLHFLCRINSSELLYKLCVNVVKFAGKKLCLSLLLFFKKVSVWRPSLNRYFECRIYVVRLQKAFKNVHITFNITFNKYLKIANIKLICLYFILSNFSIKKGDIAR